MEEERVIRLRAAHEPAHPVDDVLLRRLLPRVFRVVGEEHNIVLLIPVAICRHVPSSVEFTKAAGWKAGSARTHHELAHVLHVVHAALQLVRLPAVVDPHEQRALAPRAVRVLVRLVEHLPAGQRLPPHASRLRGRLHVRVLCGVHRRRLPLRGLGKQRGRGERRVLRVRHVVHVARRRCGAWAAVPLLVLLWLLLVLLLLLLLIVLGRRRGVATVRAMARARPVLVCAVIRCGRLLARRAAPVVVRAVVRAVFVMVVRGVVVRRVVV